jgi:TLC domain
MVRKESNHIEAIPKKFPIIGTVLGTLGHNKIQSLFFLIFLLICPFLGLFLREFNRIYQMRIINRPDYPWPEYSDIGIALIFSILIASTIFALQKLSIGLGKNLISDKYQGTERTERAEKMVKNFFKGLYFVFSSFFAYYIAQDAYFMPRSLGGKGKLEDIYKDTPYFDSSNIYYLKEYFMIQLGYHFQSLVVHIFSKIRNDFMEMLLHHSVTVMLLSLAYLMNYQPISLLILYSHDISDIFVCFSRVFVDTDFKPGVLFFYVSLMISWVYTRLYVFPFELIYISCYKNSMIHEIYGIGILGAMVHILFILHVYWFCLLIKIGIKFIKTSKAVDLQQNLSSSKS